MRKRAFPSWSPPPATASASSSPKHGHPAVVHPGFPPGLEWRNDGCEAELVRCDRRGGIDFEKLEATRRRLGIVGDGEGWPEEFNDPAFSRQVLGLDDD